MKPGGSLKPQQMFAVIAVLAVVILWVYARYIVAPLMHEAKALDDQVRTGREQLKALEAATANEASLRQQHQELNQTVSSLRNLLPGEEELSTAIERLSELASQAQVKIQTIFPQRALGEQDVMAGAPKEGTASLPVVYKTIPIQIDAVAGYHQLGTFLSLVELGDKPMRVASLRISANPREPKRHLVKLLIMSYFATQKGEEREKSPLASAAGAR